MFDNSSAHLAWCALVSLGIARQDQQIDTIAAEDLYLVRWLSNARHQRRFPKSVASDLDWLLQQGRQHSSRARLRETLLFIYETGISETEKLNDLLRLSRALNAIKEHHWVYMLLSDKEWKNRHKRQFSAGVNGIYLRKRELDNGFDDNGSQHQPLNLLVTGDQEALAALLEDFQWRLLPVRDCYQLMSGREMAGTSLRSTE
ncbi:DUF2913 family protein [Trabulsiella odontotermitis]|uniref:DUF2913 domain-containing protein n=1 Tax=Trabulsiella odontotermitis TaxID=379893 RepID=A0A0L0H252_9ENTR|nr:DUF2913 family protein [Trabulsiella odontotermitis]KNC94823.1 hypothetical protein GM31_12420 [Trabulsiella odontotermitis]